MSAVEIVPGLTALVLAGSRAGGDPLAAYAGVTHKALIEIGGLTMLARVTAALAAAPQIGRIVVAIETPGIVAALPPCAKSVTAIAAVGAGPSASVAAALRSYGTPLLVTTADHPLLQSGWVSEFVAAAPPAADAIIALARREAVMAAAPDTQRTWMRFSNGDYSGCNLFLLQTPAAVRAVELWREIEADRKRPLQLLRRLGLTYAARYRVGRLSLDDALARLGALSSAHLAQVTLTDGRAAIDVDKPADLDLVRGLLSA